MAKAQLIMLRHGESCWNKSNLFTGWVDVPLSTKGIEESLVAGKLFQHIPIDVIFTSTLVRAQMSAFLAMSDHSQKKVPVVMHSEGKLAKWGNINDPNTRKNCIPVYMSWELNERMYGELQGVNKSEMVKKFGKEQVQLWRRSFDIAPPQGESLKMTAERSIPYFKDRILPFLKESKNVFICAHGNSLRSICMYLDQLTESEVLHFEIPTGVPLFYMYENGKFSKDKSLT